MSGQRCFVKEPEALSGLSGKPAVIHGQCLPQMWTGSSLPSSNPGYTRDIPESIPTLHPPHLDLIPSRCADELEVAKRGLDKFPA